MAKVLDSLTFPIERNGATTNETFVNNPLSTASQFSTSTAYSVGQYVYYSKKLYRFTSAHAAGAWNASHVTEVTVASELADLKEDTAELKQDYNELVYHNYTEGKLLLSNNVITDDARYCLSDYIPVTGGTTIRIIGGNIPEDYALTWILEYNSSKTTVDYWGIPKDNTGRTVSLSASTAYVRFSFVPGYDVQVIYDNMIIWFPVERKNRQWEDKKWYAFGTSISDSSFPMPYDLPGYTGKYPSYLKMIGGMTHINCALGGSRISNASTADRDTILEKILATDISDADLITIDLPVNDFGACTIGTLENLTPETADDTTFYGAMFLAITHCLENSNAVVCLLTDNTGKIWTTPQGETHPTDLRPWKKDGNGKTQDDYCDAMRKIATYLGCYCIDAGSMSSINYCHPEYIADTIHQSQSGGKQYANAIWSELKEIQPNVAR